MSTVIDLTKSSIFALLQQGMKDRHAYGIATLISLCSELFDVFEQYAKDELEAEDRAESKNPIYAYRRKGLEYFCTCDEVQYNELAQKPNLFEVTIFYAAPK